MKLNKWIHAIAVFIFVFSVALISTPWSASAAPSSYQQTCSNIGINGNVLSANCRKRDQSPNQTSITLKGIENIDGTFKVLDPSKVANFNLTCTDTSVSGDFLAARCRKINGAYVGTTTSINGIENIDGVLRYTSQP